MDREIFRGRTWGQKFFPAPVDPKGVPGAVYKTPSLLARQKVKPGLFDALCGDPENDL